MTSTATLAKFRKAQALDSMSNWNHGGRERFDERQARAYAVYIVGQVAYGMMTLDEANEMVASAESPAFAEAFDAACAALVG